MPGTPVITRRLLYSVASKFIGIEERAGAEADPHVVCFLRSCWKEATSDEIPWCSGFVNYVTWLLGAPRSQSLKARTWLAIGREVVVPELGDIVVLQRGEGLQPGKHILDAPGHVGVFAGYSDTGAVKVLAGNQKNQVNIQPFSPLSVLSFRRIIEDA